MYTCVVYSILLQTVLGIPVTLASCQMVYVDEIHSPLLGDKVEYGCHSAPPPPQHVA
jgi:hypothetical protein